MDFGWPNVELGQKMANGQLLALNFSSFNSCTLKYLDYGLCTTIQVKVNLCHVIEIIG